MKDGKYELVSLYQYEYKIIPRLIEMLLQKRSNISDFISFMSDMDCILNGVLAYSNLQCDFDTSELSATVSVIKERIPVIVYSFPTPDSAPLAKFGAIVLDGDNVKYFTLEKFEYKESGWVLGSMSTKLHSNYGNVDDCASPEEFVSLLEKMFYQKKAAFFDKLLKMFLWPFSVCEK